MTHNVTIEYDSDQVKKNGASMDTINFFGIIFSKICILSDGDSPYWDRPNCLTYRNRVFKEIYNREMTKDESILSIILHEIGHLYDLKENYLSDAYRMSRVHQVEMQAFALEIKQTNLSLESNEAYELYAVTGQEAIANKYMLDHIEEVWSMLFGIPFGTTEEVAEVA